jgi:hypothetical protein
MIKCHGSVNVLTAMKWSDFSSYNPNKLVGVIGIMRVYLILICAKQLYPFFKAIMYRVFAFSDQQIFNIGRSVMKEFTNFPSQLNWRIELEKVGFGSFLDLPEKTVKI